MNPQGVLQRFQLPHENAQIRPFGDGHINNTFLISFPKERYILQRINTGVFTKPEQVMENALLVTDFLREKYAAIGRDPARSTLRFVPTKESKFWHRDESGFWRMSRYVDNTYSLFCAKDAHQFELSGAMFGEFQQLLTDFDAACLHEVIPDFHNTPKRYEALCDAVKADAVGRLNEVQRELEFIEEHRALVYEAARLYEAGDLPMRVTHNDTKFNNVLLDEHTHAPVCVVDLDTVMPGFSINDFGDAIRSGACTCQEDDPNFENACVNVEFFDAFARGFLSSCKHALTECELHSLTLGAIGMTLEVGIRFLTDYLSGDVYFHCAREKHNLDRCRTQLHMVQDLCEKRAILDDCIEKQMR